eukprot:Rmarinus@m.23577
MLATSEMGSQPAQFVQRTHGPTRTLIRVFHVLQTLNLHLEVHLQKAVCVIPAMRGTGTHFVKAVQLENGRQAARLSVNHALPTERALREVSSPRIVIAKQGLLVMATRIAIYAQKTSGQRRGCPCAAFVLGIALPQQVHSLVLIVCASRGMPAP